MRERVIAEVEGGASRREAAEEFEASASTAMYCFARWDDLFRAYFLAINVGDATGLLEYLRSLFYEHLDIRFGG
jgi:hypothetical protein